MSKATQLHRNTDATDRYKHGDIARALAGHYSTTEIGRCGLSSTFEAF
jgi:hypothetical protein